MQRVIKKNLNSILINPRQWSLSSSVKRGLYQIEITLFLGYFISYYYVSFLVLKTKKLIKGFENVLNSFQLYCCTVWFSFWLNVSNKHILKHAQLRAESDRLGCLSSTDVWTWENQPHGDSESSRLNGVAVIAKTHIHTHPHTSIL